MLLSQAIITVLVSALAGESIASAVPQLTRTPRCRTLSPSAEEKEAIQREMDLAKAANPTRFEKRADEVFNIDVYIHVVAKSKAEKGGYVPRAKIDAMMDVFNASYNTTSPYRWNLKDVEWVINTKWEPDYTLEKDYDMKKTMRKGNYRTLNVYFLKNWSGGYTVLPKKVEPNSRDFYEDGIVLGPDAVPGGNNPAYDQGKVLTHEAGHWLGLYHTFEGGCDAPGDYVDDTPYERFDNFEACPANRDSCPDQPGLDPINNYMDYTADECKSEFTPGQYERMLDSYMTFRSQYP